MFVFYGELALWFTTSNLNTFKKELLPTKLYSRQQSLCEFRPSLPYYGNGDVFGVFFIAVVFADIVDSAEVNARGTFFAVGGLAVPVRTLAVSVQVGGLCFINQRTPTVVNR